MIREKCNSKCAWYVLQDDQELGSSDPRCDTYDNLIGRKCPSDKITNITTEYISKEVSCAYVGLLIFVIIIMLIMM